MAAPSEVLSLIERFDRNLDAYRSGAYNETKARREFIDPLFVALGWDVENRAGYAEAYKDVVHEDAIKVGGLTKAPDYCFRVGGARKFFVEAKKPSVNVKDDIAPAFQLRRYAWSAKLPLSILTDFEELAVYDCRVKPDKSDAASAARTLYLTFSDYDSRWGEIAQVFSKEAVLQGSFDRYAETTKAKKGTAEVDKAFLGEIESWRDSLARTIALRNGGLSQRELNYAVQTTIDRIIFLRICEDRGIEDYGRLQGLLNGGNIYARLCDLYRQADQRYNSGLFHFEPERGREQPDELTPGLTIDDKTLKEILKRLYYPDSPYEFSVLPADILGQVYEQFLGKVIRLTAGHRAVVEDKPQVKKAGGVYYTPTTIVDYIVKNTVGELLASSTPQKAASLRILDPACGSGSFLIGAFQYLIDWHRDWYVEHDPAKHAKDVFRGPGGEWRLTTAAKKRILLNNIYGVDIDSQAVETTKLSLLLKVLEGETQETINAQLSFLHERALPDLAANIKCGNSLIGPEFYDDQQLGMLLDDAESRRIGVFDWERAHPEVMKRGGFDAVIGNPPYIRIQNLREFAPREVEFYKQRYASASKGNYDIYVVFVERGLSLLREHGRLGFILPSKFLATDYGEPLRGLLTETGALDRLVDFGHAQVFQTATTYTCLLFLARGQSKQASYLRSSLDKLEGGDPSATALSGLDRGPWLLVSDATARLLDKLRQQGRPLLEIPAAMSRGTSTGDDGVFCLQTTEDGLRSRDGEPVEVESSILRRPLYATDFTRFDLRLRNSEALVFPYSVSSNGYRPFDEDELRDQCPLAYAYLKRNKSRLQRRKQYKDWYGFSAPRNLHIHGSAHFVVPLLADRGLCAPLPETSSQYCLMASGGFSVRLELSEVELDPRYVLGCVNSKPLFWYLRQISNKFRGGWITCTKQYFGTLPIRLPGLEEMGPGTAYARVVELVSAEIELRERLRVASTTTEMQTDMQSRIDVADERLDRTVCEIYGLTSDEVALIDETPETTRAR